MACLDETFWGEFFNTVCLKEVIWSSGAKFTLRLAAGSNAISASRRSKQSFEESHQPLSFISSTGKKLPLTANFPAAPAASS